MGIFHLGYIGVFMMLLQLVIVGLGIYFLIAVIQFMKQKQKTDAELIKKLEDLINKKNE